MARSSFPSGASCSLVPFDVPELSHISRQKQLLYILMLFFRVYSLVYPEALHMLTREELSFQQEGGQVFHACSFSMELPILPRS